jgi:8-oxo-dGTP pyrophosphatase MutT (NUDIX family)
MLELYLYIHEQFNKGLRIEFSFLPDEIPDDIFVTSAMVFCIDTDNRICLVKDGHEDFYSLPGGGRKLLESPLECAKRELQEEAQIIAKNFKIFGTIVVSFYSNDVLISKMQQARYICDVDVMEEFVPFKDGFETDERIFVWADQLLTLVKQFKNDNGIQIVAHLVKVQRDRESNASMSDA